MNSVASDLQGATGKAGKSDRPPLRFVTAASLFDGHDAAINIIRRILQSHGAEVIHLGHNRSVADIVRAAIQEDVDGVAVSSYQGGHNEYFRYMVDMLRAAGNRAATRGRSDYPGTRNRRPVLRRACGLAVQSRAGPRESCARGRLRQPVNRHRW
jgi:hypothetical protein